MATPIWKTFTMDKCSGGDIIWLGAVFRSPVLQFWDSWRTFSNNNRTVK